MTQLLFPGEKLLILFKLILYLQKKTINEKWKTSLLNLLGDPDFLKMRIIIYFLNLHVQHQTSMKITLKHIVAEWPWSVHEGKNPHRQLVKFIFTRIVEALGEH